MPAAKRDLNAFKSSLKVHLNTFKIESWYAVPVHIYEPNKPAKLLILGALLAVVIRMFPFVVFLIAGGAFDPGFGFDDPSGSTTGLGGVILLVDFGAAVVMFVNALAAALAISIGSG